MRKVEWHGHRGCRGLRPENSLPAFRHATELGVDALEMDVVISGDREVIIAHEAFMPAHICRRPDGRSIDRAEQISFNLYEMSTEDLQAFDCGLPHPEFPEQESSPVHRPRLAELFEMMEEEFPEHPIRYTIELKCKKEEDDIYHPGPEEFVRLTLDAVRAFGKLKDCLFQSFDLRVLRAFRSQAPEVSLAALIEQPFQLSSFCEEIGFRPDVLGPKFTLVDSELVEACHAHDMRIIPWTVNEVSDMRRLIDMGVDGIITDYPDRRP